MDGAQAQHRRRRSKANHWRLIDRWAHIAHVGGDGRSATVRLRGPLGMRRTARTQIVAAIAPFAMVGEARVGRRTIGRVRWTLARDGAGTIVTLAAHVPAAGPFDHALLALGGRRWLRRRFAGALALLAAEASAVALGAAA